ncbi:hypothetical protein Tco_0066499 [Tanacetum coccineum]
MLTIRISQDHFYVEVPKVPRVVGKAYGFPILPRGAATDLLEERTPRSIRTWMILFDETFSEAWDSIQRSSTGYTAGNVYRDNIQEYVSQAAVANYNQGNTGYRAPISNKFDLPVIQSPAYQAPAYQAPAPQIQGVSKEDFQAYVKANDAVMRNMQTQGQNMQNQLTNLTEMLSKFITSNTASTLGSRTLPSNTVTNPKEDLKGYYADSGVAYKASQDSTTFLK